MSADNSLSQNMTSTEADSSQPHANDVVELSRANSEDNASSSSATPASGEGGASRQSNLQRIQQRKQQVYNWPHNKKLLKLAIYSACQEPNTLPDFVAKDLHRLPPVSFDHIDAASLLKDILVLKQDIFFVRNNYATLSTLADTKEQIELNLKTTIDQLKPTQKGVLTKDEGRKPFCIKQNQENINLDSFSLLSSTIKPEGSGENIDLTVIGGAKPAAAALPGSVLRTPPGTSPPPPPLHPAKKRRHRRKQNKTTNSLNKHQTPFGSRPLSGTTCQKAQLQKPAINLLNCDKNLDENTKDCKTDYNTFKTVVNKNKLKKQRKSTVNLQGKALLTSNKIKVAPRLSYIFVTRFDVTISSQDIKDFISESGKEIIEVEKIVPYHKTNFSSFKITVDQKLEQSLLSEDFWPCGVEYRRFTFKRIYHENSKKSSHGTH
ncbi:hypothetical protein NE865_07716 [Phthorimaea operculella]|nr:hypothetical protein NE865_07716 [Phthorimaea operculella]